LSIALSIGYENFTELLAGAHAMDNHFKICRAGAKPAVALALVGIW